MFCREHSCHVVLSPEGVVLVNSPGTKSAYPRPPQSLNPSFSTCSIENVPQVLIGGTRIPRRLIILAGNFEEFLDVNYDEQ